MMLAWDLCSMGWARWNETKIVTNITIVLHCSILQLIYQESTNEAKAPKSFFSLFCFLFCSFYTEPPPIIQVPNNITAVPGEAAILTCLTLSTVRYNLTWQRNGRDVRLKEPLRIRVLSNLSLEVKTVKFTDAGKYNCIASNEGGSTTASVFLTVQGNKKTAC